MQIPSVAATSPQSCTHSRSPCPSCNSFSLPQTLLAAPASLSLSAWPLLAGPARLLSLASKDYVRLRPPHGYYRLPSPAIFSNRFGWYIILFLMILMPAMPGRDLYFTHPCILPELMAGGRHLRTSTSPSGRRPNRQRCERQIQVLVLWLRRARVFYY